MNLPELSVKRKTAMLMVFLAAILLGGIVFIGLKLDLLPKIEPPVVNILTTWPGASAGDVEQSVSKRLEDSLTLIEGVDKIFSKSMDNISVVTVQFKWGENLDVKMGDIRDSVNIAKRDLPSDAEEPILLRITSGTIPFLTLSLTAKRSLRDCITSRSASLSRIFPASPEWGRCLSTEATRGRFRYVSTRRSWRLSASP